MTPAGDNKRMTARLVEELAALTALPGPSGQEGAVARYLVGELRRHGLSTEVDAIGNVVLRGQAAPSGLVSAHMDQVGFMVSRVERTHALCLPVGDPELGGPQPVRIVAAGEVKGAGRLEPQDAESGVAVLRTEDPGHVAVGDRVLYARTLEERDGIVEACALDDRIGCWILLRAAIELAGVRPDLAFAWTVREETDAGGIVHAARRLQPAWTVSVDGTSAGGDETTGDSEIRVGRGPAITLLDGGMVAHAPLLDAFASAAGAQDIAWQREVVTEGTSEAGVVGAALGIPGLALLVPLESVHTAAERASLGDIEDARSLLIAGLMRTSVADRPPR